MREPACVSFKPLLERGAGRARGPACAGRRACRRMPVPRARVFQCLVCAISANVLAGRGVPATSVNEQTDGAVAIPRLHGGNPPWGRAQGHDGGNRGQIPLVLALHFGQLPRKPQSTELKGPPPNPIRQTEPHTPNWERPGLYRGGAPGAGNPCHHQKFMCLVHERQGSCTTWGSQWKLRIAPLLISSRRLRQRAGPVPNTRMLHSWPVHFRPSMPTWANTCRNAGWDAGSALSFAGIACSLNLCGPAPSISTTCTHPGHESPQHRLRNDCRTPVTR